MAGMWLNFLFGGGCILKDYLQTMDFSEDNEAVLYVVYGCSLHPDACLVYTVTSLIKPVSHCIIPEI